jgi:hypothetical protein
MIRLLSEIKVATAGLAFAGECGFQILFGFAACKLGQATLLAYFRIVLK